MSNDGTQLVSVDSNTGRMIHQSFWDTDFRTKVNGSTNRKFLKPNYEYCGSLTLCLVFKKELPPMNGNLFVDMTKMDITIGVNDSVALASKRDTPKNAVCVQARV